jgi:hypothetical protein
MQDGGISSFSGNSYGSAEALSECVKAFREYFPDGHVHQSADNIGIARNIRRGEEFVFKDLNKEVGYFFEDDLELGPYYLSVMEFLRSNLAGVPGAGYFAAYGDHRKQITGENVGLVAMEHNWGYGLFRDAWAKIAKWLEPYNKIVDRTDYRYRCHLQVFEFYRTLRVASDKSSQDSAKALACADLGLSRVMTEACFAKYIGSEGQSFNVKKFTEMGYGGTTLYAHINPTIETPSEASVRKLWEADRAAAMKFRSTALESFLEGYKKSNADPDRMVSAADVRELYLLLLNREPEPAVYEYSVGKRPFNAMRRQLLESLLEGYDKNNADQDRMVSAADVRQLYLLLLNREPEPAVCEYSVGKRPFKAMGRQLLESNEFRGGAGAFRFLTLRPQSEASL